MLIKVLNSRRGCPSPSSLYHQGALFVQRSLKQLVWRERGGEVEVPPFQMFSLKSYIYGAFYIYTSFTKYCNITKIPFICIQIEFWEIFIRVNNNNLYTKQSYTKPRDVAIDVTLVVTRSFEFCSLIQDNPTQHFVASYDKQMVENVTIERNLSLILQKSKRTVSL